MIYSQTHKHLLSKAHDAQQGGEDAWGCQSTGEKIAVALVLNRHDWLASMGYTVGEAIDRLGSEWTMAIPEVERALKEEAGESV
jgi:hypothetical protein